MALPHSHEAALFDKDERENVGQRQESGTNGGQQAKQPCYPKLVNGISLGRRVLAKSLDTSHHKGGNAGVKHVQR